MFQSAYSLLNIFDTLNQITGRKKLQKIVHLLEVSGFKLPFKYEYHFYGPYSADLQEEISYLVQQEFLEEIKEDETYIYIITEKGKQFKQSLEENGGHELHINNNLLQKLDEQNSQFLEMVSTYAFLVESGYLSGEAKLKALELKSHLSKYIDDAIEFYHTYFSKN